MPWSFRNLPNRQHGGESKTLPNVLVRVIPRHVSPRLNLLNSLVVGVTWKLGGILWPWARHPATKFVDGRERKGNVTSGTQESRPFARTQSVRCVALSKHRISPQGGGSSGLGSTLLRPRQSPSLLNLMVVVERVSNVEVLIFRSNDYSKNVNINSEWKAMLLNNVVVGYGKKLTQRNHALTEPPLGYDSVSVFRLIFLWAP